MAQNDVIAEVARTAWRGLRVAIADYENNSPHKNDNHVTRNQATGRFDAYLNVLSVIHPEMTKEQMIDTACKRAKKDGLIK